jgi:hypothetical protein
LIASPKENKKKCDKGKSQEYVHYLPSASAARICRDFAVGAQTQQLGQR